MTMLPEPSAIKLGLVIDLDICVGCQACVVNCKEWNTAGYGAPLADEDAYGAAIALESAGESGQATVFDQPTFSQHTHSTIRNVGGEIQWVRGLPRSLLAAAAAAAPSRRCAR